MPNEDTVMALNANKDEMMALNAETGNVTPNVNLGSEDDGSERRTTRK